MQQVQHENGTIANEYFENFSQVRKKIHCQTITTCIRAVAKNRSDGLPGGGARSVIPKY